MDGVIDEVGLDENGVDEVMEVVEEMLFEGGDVVFVEEVKDEDVFKLKFCCLCSCKKKEEFVVEEDIVELEVEFFVEVLSELVVEIVVEVVVEEIVVKEIVVEELVVEEFVLVVELELVVEVEEVLVVEFVLDEFVKLKWCGWWLMGC